jgi:hypothetical protein
MPRLKVLIAAIAFVSAVAIPAVAQAKKSKQNSASQKRLPRPSTSIARVPLQSTPPTTNPFVAIDDPVYVGPKQRPQVSVVDRSDVVWTLNDDRNVKAYFLDVIDVSTFVKNSGPLCCGFSPNGVASPAHIRLFELSDSEPVHFFRYAVKALYNDGTWGPYGYSAPCQQMPDSVEYRTLRCGPR